MSASMAEDLTAFLLADPVLSPLFGTKVYNGAQPRASELPYLSFEKTESSPRNLLTGAGVDQVTVYFYVRASAAADAERLAATVKGRVLPRPGYSPSRFVGAWGLECGRFFNGPDATALDPDRGPSNADVWVASFPVVFTVARG